MFNDFDTSSEDERVSNQANKKRKYVEKKSEMIHSSLDYHTIRVPPLVEYKGIDSYCERKGVTGSDTPISSLSSISGPVVFKTPRPAQPDIPLPTSDCQPFCFFSVEELSLVKSLDNWTNRKVCAVGNLDYVHGTNECYLNSVGENGSWKILMNVSNLKSNPAPLKVWQIYGVLNIHEGKPEISVCFVRNLGTADLPLLVESYKLMEQYVPTSLNVLKTADMGEGDEQFG